MIERAKPGTYRGAIHHPDTPKRQAEIDGIQASMAGADRFELQRAVMPFDLPEKYRGRNERVAIGYE